MIVSLRMRDRHKIGVNSSGKLEIDGNKLSIKDIPFLRFRFNSYGDEEIQYIKEMAKKFSCSTMLAEVELDENTLENVKRLREEIVDIAVFVYTDIYGVEAEQEELEDTKLELLTDLADEVDIDRICLRDRTDSLDYVELKKLVENTASETFIDEEDFAICESPLSFGEMACLTAVKARELMANYSKIDDVPLPSANHQKGCCGCIQFLNIEKDYEAPAESKKAATKKTDSSDTVKKEKTVVKKKKGLSMSCRF